MRNSLYAMLMLLAFSIKAGGQEAASFSGSFESSTHYYLDDDLLGIFAPQNRFASNNYMLVQYRNGPFSAGLMYEAYMPPLSGYPYQLEGAKISHRYLNFRKGIIDVTAGNFYEQFGSGLSFRAYEDRFLGINSSVDGVRIMLRPVKGMKLKGIYGRQRKYLDFADPYLRGVDWEIDLGPLLAMEKSLSLGMGILSKYESYTGPDANFPSTVNAMNGRLGLDTGGLSIYSEFVYKTDDPNAAMNNLQYIPGRALSSRISYSAKRLGIFVASRFLDNLYFYNDRILYDGFSDINYLPSNTRQHSYALSNLYPYTTQGASEASVQADVNYSFRGNRALAGPYGTGIRLNYSLSRDLGVTAPGRNNIVSFGEKLLYQDINLEINRRWTRNLRTLVLIQNISFNQGAIEYGGDDLIYSTILVADLRYRFTSRFSARAEVQHLWTGQDHGNWLAWRIEATYSPLLSIYVYDLTDYEYQQQVHYLNSGFSLNFDFMRVNVGYGRNREGYICSGGVCRKVPAYRGFSLGINSSF